MTCKSLIVIPDTRQCLRDDATTGAGIAGARKSILKPSLTSPNQRGLIQARKGETSIMTTLVGHERNCGKGLHVLVTRKVEHMGKQHAHLSSRRLQHKIQVHSKQLGKNRYKISFKVVTSKLITGKCNGTSTSAGTANDDGLQSIARTRLTSSHLSGRGVTMLRA
jgi:hypothetical protein